MSDITFRLTGGTNVGLVRTNNEDNFIVNADLTKKEWFIPNDASKTINLGNAGCLFVVADGMGGMNAGEVASAIAIDSVKTAFSVDDFSKIIDTPNHIKEFLQKTIEQADCNIKNKVKQDPSTAGMGTTIIIAWVLDDIVNLSWCGDSRAYLFNAKSGLTRLSKDHSYVQQLVDEGKLDPELAFDHPNSNIITRSLGDVANKACPDFVSRKLVEGDNILLCSDGLCGLCRDDKILEVMHNDIQNIERCKNSLIAAALDAGGYDNVTITLFQVATIVENENEKLNVATRNDFKKTRRCSPKYLPIVLVIMIIGAVAILAFINIDSIIQFINVKITDPIITDTITINSLTEFVEEPINNNNK